MTINKFEQLLVKLNNSLAFVHTLTFTITILKDIARRFKAITSK